MERMDDETIRTYQLIALCNELTGVELGGSSDLASFREDMRAHLQAVDEGRPVPPDIETLIKSTRESLGTLDGTLGSAAVKATKFDIGF